VEQPKTIEPLLTEEAIKILNVENEAKEVKEEPVVTEPEPIKEQTVVPEPVLEPVVTEPELIKEEPVISETKEPEVEQLSIVQPDEVSSISSKDEEEVPSLKKKRGRKKKSEQ
jgi:hypothetical protein